MTMIDLDQKLLYLALEKISSVIVFPIICEHTCALNQIYVNFYKGTKNDKKNKVIFHQGVKEVRPISSRKDILLMVDEVDGDDAQV